MAINELFSNITWTLGQAEDLDDEAVLRHWKHPLTNIYVTLVLFIIMNFLMAVISNTLPLPAGVFVPVFTIGAAFGRLVGESMAAWFPAGIPSGDIVRKIVPGGYAVVGAASLSGSVTRTISTAVIVFEVTGQISHVLPAVVSVLIANAVANMLQPSFYDSIIKLKRLPYLPDIVSAKSNAWLLYVEDFMVHDVHFISFGATYQDLQELLVHTRHRSYPLVDSKDSMILLGSIQRLELERILLVHISHDNQVMWSLSHRVGPPSIHGPRSPPLVITSVPEEEAVLEDKSEVGGAAEGAGKEPEGASIRFRVTRVPENEARASEDSVDGDSQQPKNSIPMKFLSVPERPRTTRTDEEDTSQQNYNTIHVPLRSILKKSSSSSKLHKARSTGDLKAEVNNFYRKLAKQRKEGILEDMPYTLDKGSFTNLYKKVKLPPEPRPTKIKNLPTEDKEAWEQRQLCMTIDWEGIQIDPAPFQLVERTSLHKVHSLFSLLGLSHAYVTNTGRLAGVVGLKELRIAVQGQIELQENGKLTSNTSINRVQGQEDIEEAEEELAPFDKGIPEVDKSGPPPLFRLQSVNARTVDSEA